ncbi:MAG: lysophospholipid acyltransferase family protein [Anaerolineae bacterium]
MTLTYRIVNTIFKGILRALCRVDDSEWHKVPEKGPLLIVVNHINFIEVPMMVTHLMPRPLTGFVKSENWEKPLTRWLFNMWNAIPLRRGEADLTAVRAGLAALADGQILAVAPEGTRTGDGRLQQGHPGIVTMALKGKATILPIAYFGNEIFWQNIKRLRRTDFYLRVGRPFMLELGDGRPTKQIRQQMIDEIMYQIARLLPPQNRGHYADLDAATEKYIHFIEDGGEGLGTGANSLTPTP